MIDRHYTDIFERFLHNDLSEEDIEELQSIMYIDKDIQRYFEYRLAEADNSINQHLQKKIFRAIQKDIGPKSKNLFSGYNCPNILLWVAVFLLPLLSGLFVYSLMQKDYRSSMPTVFTVQKGEKAEVILPDGTNVWINSGSTLRYDGNFNRRQRLVMLDGEAYFEVAPDINSLFTVKTPTMDIQALGTAFNVRSYANDRQASTVLLEGKVKVVASGEEKILDVNQRIQFDKETQTFIIDRVQASHFIEWKSGNLYFNNQTYYDIAQTLSRIYNVNIQLASQELLPIRLTGTLGSNGIKNALDILSLTSPMHYEVRDSIIYLYYNNE